MKKITILLLSVLLMVSENQAMAKLKIDSVSPNVGLVGGELQVTIKGEGFNAYTRVSMSLDSGNSANIIGSLDTPGNAQDIAVSGDFAYVTYSKIFFNVNIGLLVIDISDPSNPLLVGSVATSGTKIKTVVGDFVYLAGNKGLQAIDVSDPSNPRVVDSDDTPGGATDQTGVGDFAYVANGSGLQVIDLSDPNNPLLIGSVDTPGSAGDVAVVGDFAFVADDRISDFNNNTGLQVIDISDRNNPQLGSRIAIPGRARGIDVRGDVAYVANLFGLQAIDISDPSNPSLIGNIDTPSNSYGLSIAGDIAYVADYTSGLQMIDISDPSSLSLIGSVDTPGVAWDVKVMGDIAYVADNSRGLQVIDISEPSNSSLIGRQDTPAYSSDLAVAGDFAYVADATSGLQVIDISDPSNPLLIGSVATPDYVYSVALSGGFAYVAAFNSGLQVIDISDPSNPLLIGSVDTPGYAMDVSLAADFAYIADSTGLQVIDISDPSNPFIVSSATTPRAARALTITGNFAYVVDYARGIGFNAPSTSSLQIIDISTPSSPLMTGSLDFFESSRPNDITVAGDFAYVALNSNGNGLQVIDISDQSSPVLVGRLYSSTGANSVKVEGAFAYLADYDLGLQVIDIQNPNNPMLIGSIATPGSTAAAVIAGALAYVADGSAGLSIIPIPVEISPVTINSSASMSVTIPAVTLSDNYNLRVFDSSNDEDTLIGAVTFMDADSYTFHRAKKTIVIAGGGPDISNGTLWDETKLVTNQAYLALNRQGYEPNQIYFLSNEDQDPDGDGLSNVEGIPTLASLDEAIEWASDASELLLFMTDHGSSGSMQLNSSEVLTVTHLDALLDGLQSVMPGQVIIIYDACYSGSFSNGIQGSVGSKRVVITSSTDSERAWFYNDGVGSFSFQFWSSAYLTGNLYDSFSEANNMVKEDQTPLLNADSDGVANNDSDFNLASKIPIGRGVAIAYAPPWIGGVNSDQSISENSEITLWADYFTSQNPIADVWAIIVPPSVTRLAADIPVTDEFISRVELTDTDGDGRYEGSYTFSESGVYTLSINAIDSEDYQALPLSIEVTVIGESGGNDDYNTDDGYTDDSPVTAADIDITGTIQKRNFSSSDDLDWIRFYGVSGYYYNIETTSLGSQADTALSVYDSDGTTLLKQLDDWEAGHDETLSWQAPADGIYYVRISQHDPSVYGAETDYNLQVYLPSMLDDGKVLGTTSTSEGVALGGVFLSADSSLCNPVFSFADGSYFMPCSAGSFTVTADRSSYEADSQTITVTAEGISYQDFSLTSLIPTLQTSINGSTASAFWDAVPNVDSYTFYYAPFPYEGEHTIVSIGMGSERFVSAELPPGAAYYVAVTSWLDGVETEYSNIELIIMP